MPQIIDLYRQAEDYFFRGISLKCMNLGDAANAYMTGGAELKGAFESTIEICRVYAGTHENALKRNINLRHFSLYKQEQPISSITLLMCDNTIARIDDVGTLPAFQGKGYASALMRYVLLEAQKLGARHCFLESSDSGLGVYQKLGFETLFKNNIYSREK